MTAAQPAVAADNATSAIQRKERTKTMTAGPSSLSRVTAREIAAARGISVLTVRRHRRSSRWPPAAGARPSSGRGRPELEYDAAAVDEFYRWVASASPQGRRGPRRAAGDWDPDELVDAATAAARLNITPSAFRGYPAGTRGSRNPLSPPTRRGLYRWGSVADWDDRRPGSGNRQPRAGLG